MGKTAPGAYQYVAYTREGEKRSGTVAVQTEAEAEALLWRTDLTVTSLRRRRSLSADLLLPLQRQLPTLFRPKANDLVGVTRQLAILLHSGIPLSSALPLLQDRISNSVLKDAFARIAQDIQAGTSFSASLGKHPSVFPRLYARLVTVGEETGRLEDVLNLVASYLERQAALSRRISASLRYPAIVVAVGILAGFLLITYSLPALTSLLKEFGGELPLITRVLIGVTDALQASFRWIIGGVVAAGLALWAYTRTAQGARRRDIVLLRAPIVGRPIHMGGMFRFTKSLHTTLIAGLPLIEALELAARVEGNAVLREAVLRTREEVLQGRSLSQSMAQQAIFPTLVPQMVSIGEQAGTLTQNLDDLATFFDSETERSLTNLAGMIEPTIVLLIGGSVGIMAVAVMSSLYGILGEIK